MGALRLVDLARVVAGRCVAAVTRAAAARGSHGPRPVPDGRLGPAPGRRVRGAQRQSPLSQASRVTAELRRRRDSAQGDSGPAVQHSPAALGQRLRWCRGAAAQQSAVPRGAHGGRHRGRGRRRSGWPAAEGSGRPPPRQAGLCGRAPASSQVSGFRELLCRACEASGAHGRRHRAGLARPPACERGTVGGRRGPCVGQWRLWWEPQRQA
mmetsp:Transcript_23231/g.87983  ORF Transcript_23231/g.87983 Transcript_23231/m.87983 type:complete len:210 (-) Transcript_23231:1-630(-)